MVLASGLYRLDGIVFCMPDSNVKLVILSAAAQVVQSAGAGHLTIDAVAKQAALSKGGVLYHFPNKRALLEGMLADLMDRMEVRHAQHRDTLAGSNLVLRSFILSEQDLSEEEHAMSLAILAAAAEDPTLLAPARQRIELWLQEIAENSDDQLLSLTLFLAMEGMRFLDMLSILPLSEQLRSDLSRKMLELAQGPSK
mgnify:CR=1 FL=1